MSTTDPRLPRADEAERYMVTCVMGWPDEAGDILPLCRPTDFFDERHHKIWRMFATQHQLRGCIDPVAVGRELGCAAYLYELGLDAATIAHIDSRAEMVRIAARGRQIHEVLTKGADAILRGRPGDAVLAQVQLALEAFEAEAVG